jgi:hypothetical protein
MERGSGGEARPLMEASPEAHAHGCTALASLETR